MQESKLIYFFANLFLGVKIPSATTTTKYAQAGAWFGRKFIANPAISPRLTTRQVVWVSVQATYKKINNEIHVGSSVVKFATYEAILSSENRITNEAIASTGKNANIRSRITIRRIATENAEKIRLPTELTSKHRYFLGLNVQLK